MVLGTEVPELTEPIERREAATRNPESANAGLRQTTPIVEEDAGVSQVAVFVDCSDWCYQQALTAALRQADDIEVRDVQGASLSQIASTASQQQPAVVVTDLPNHGDIDAQAVIREILDGSADLRLVIVGVDADTPISPLVALGATGVFRRGEVSGSAQFLSIIRGAANGLFVMVPQHGDAAAGALQSATLDQYRLTERERQVLRLLAEGLTNREIASRTHFAMQTIKNTVSSLLRKLGVPNRVEARRVARTLLL
jgi:DNA-binding NarL/FixJ family response regulator